MKTTDILRNDTKNAHALFEALLKALIEILADDKEKAAEKNAPRANNSVYNNANNAAYPNNQTVKISELMQNYGITAEDFQAVYKDNPEIINALGGGKTCKKLAKSADRVITEYRNGKPVTGKCLPGVRDIYDKAGVDSLNNQTSRNAIIRSRFSYQKNNGGGNGYVGLEASGDYFTIKVKNEAYGKTKNGPEDKKMNELLQDIQPGITITVDSIENNSDRQKAGNTNGGKYGHIAVKRNDGNWGCDFNQNSINFDRYGKYARICVPKDAEISSEYAQMLIEYAQERQQAQIKTKQMANAKTQTMRA